jgi:hypothetical protein
MLILLIFLSTPMQSKQAASRLPPLLSGKLGPQGTIAKPGRERKEKSQKRPEKCRFFWGRVEITRKNAVLARSRTGKSAGTEADDRVYAAKWFSRAMCSSGGMDISSGSPKPGAA